MNKWPIVIRDIVLLTIVSILIFNGSIAALYSIGVIIIDYFSNSESGNFILLFSLFFSFFLIIFVAVTITLIIMFAMLENYNISVAKYAISLGLAIFIYSYFIDFFFLYNSSNTYVNTLLGLTYILLGFVITKLFFDNKSSLPQT